MRTALKSGISKSDTSGSWKMTNVNNKKNGRLTLFYIYTDMLISIKEKILQKVFQ